VASALARAACGRPCEFYDPPVAFAAFRENADDGGLAERTTERIRAHLRANMGEHRPDDVPARYPGLHGGVGRDLVLEADYKSSQRAAFEAGKRIRDFLERYGASYRVKYSGNCSMHFVLPQAVYEPLLKEEVRAQAFPRLFNWLTERLKDQMRPATLDDSFDDPDHYLRLPYSLNERTGLVSLPVRAEDYDDFHPERAEMSDVTVEDFWFKSADPPAQREGMARMLREALGEDAVRFG
jgi:hypothetical protein